MDPLFDCCCGLDVHKDTVVACLLKSTGKKVEKTVRTVSTVTSGLLGLRDWLEAAGCTQVAMESTGVYWKPVFNILEDSCDVILANARDLKHVPGRKTDVGDAEWIATLLRNGLIKASFIPPQPIRQLRDLTRYRKKLVGDASAEKNRVQKYLEDTNIKLSSVATDIFGQSGRAMLDCLLQAEPLTAEHMAQLAKGRMRSKIPQLIEALNGRVSEHHRFLLRSALDHLGYLEQAIANVEQEIERRLEPYREAVELVKTIPGVSEHVAATLVAELGTDMSVFPTAQHLSSWAGVSPGNHESAGKKKQVRAKRGNNSLRVALCEAAWAASRTRNTYLAAKYWKMAGRQGKKKAIVTIAHKIAVIAYHILSTKEPYRELGRDHVHHMDTHIRERRLVSQLVRMGYKVERDPSTGDDSAIA